MSRIAILGDGITGKAVHEKCQECQIQVTDINKANIIVTSPGIPKEDTPKTEKEILSEVEFAYRLLQLEERPPTLIGITGTNGKSTTTALVAHLLDCPVAGNIGVPLIQFVRKEPLVLSVELSSYQLERCSLFTPNIAILLNLTEDHMARHKTMAQYSAEKAKLIQNMTSDQTIIYNPNDPHINQMVKTSSAKLIPCDPAEGILTHLTLPGQHNQINASCAVWAARAYGISDDVITKRLQTFQGLPHRLEKVDQVNGRDLYNDSKATNTESTQIAVEAFKDPVHLILCGDDKGLNMDTLMRKIEKKVSSISIYGGISERVFALSKKINEHYPIQKVDALEDALSHCYSQSKEGDIILFSPSSSSFDHYRNFEARGECFREEVLKLKKREALT